ncbi:unnamed protein product [Adineta steineri]|uniref:Homeobox domain-containing protein n=1 Tax=Adineta steineri TaxID=433720 RepID=A0A818HVG0_9BILA|nr:unnamed protein product [Adineta steineri]CAF1028101.1 unnamed protein product [Adineta steineri]CAF3514965.1 unnamed protein product [Adineta steineri]CAF4043091.1 unnamed protein product [Adineta steineri]
MSSTSSSDDDNDENRFHSNDTQLITAQKSLIYKHPLFPVLTYVLERCEQATLNPSLLLTNDESFTSSSFEHNLKIFLSKNPEILTTPKHDNDGTSTSSAAIIDNFYIDAMQVLRIHLLELDKVNDLCRDFCQRYIACLKVKLNANNIFTDDEDDDDDDDVNDEDEDFELNINDDFESSEENDDDDDDFMTNEKNITKDQHYGKQSVSNNGFNSICHPYTTQFNGQTPLSKIIASGPSPMVDSSVDLFDSFCTKRRKQSTIVPSSSSSSSKRGVLPKSATSIMRSWLFQHIVHPYPTEDEKRAISQKTNLSLLQVNNWFINARRRILQPMLEASNPDLAATKKKKRHETTTDDHHHTHARQISNINRYWPSNLAQFDTTTTRDQRKK